jgi:glycosyltransferase involved in cell wall biosynthesis
MKILFIADTEANYIVHTHEAFRHGLQRMFSARMYGRGYPGYDPSINDYEEIINLVFPHDKPDLVVTDYCHASQFENVKFPYKGWERISVDKAINLSAYWNITENYSDAFIGWLQQKNTAFVLSQYPRPIRLYSNQIPLINFLLVPPCFDPCVINDWGLEKKYDVGFLGAGVTETNSFYPERNRIHQQLVKRHDFKYLSAPHPGYEATPDHPVAGRNFSMLLNSCKMHIVTGGKYNNPVGKYFETMASNCLLLGIEPEGADQLHMVDGVNYIKISEDDVLDKVDYYLARPELCRKIAEAGYRTAMQFHSCYARALGLRNLVEPLLSSSQPAKESNAEIVVNTGPTPTTNDLSDALFGTRRPRVLFCVDAPGWAHDFKTTNLIKHLSHRFECRKVYDEKITRDDIAWAEVIVIYYWPQFRVLIEYQDLLHSKIVLSGISSPTDIEGAQRFEMGMRVFNFVQGVFVHNQHLYEDYKAVFENKPFYLNPNGVDTDFYSPALEPKQIGQPLIVGWAGSLENHGTLRGYHDILVPAVKMTEGVELRTAAREDKFRGPAEMLEFYRTLDVYLVGSRVEGTPNPGLESAACGVTIISTRVGNMPELIRDGENGFLVDERTPEAFSARMAVLRDSRDLLHRMRSKIREDIKEWDWKIKAQNYGMMIADSLARYGSKLI